MAKWQKKMKKKVEEAAKAAARKAELVKKEEQLRAKNDTAGLAALKLKQAGGGIAAKLSAMKDIIMSIEIPGLARPHPWVTPLHLACRFGQAEICQLLINRHALTTSTWAISPKSPLQEALAYARKNFTCSNAGSAQANWNRMMDSLKDIPPMSTTVRARIYYFCIAGMKTAACYVL